MIDIFMHENILHTTPWPYFTQLPYTLTMMARRWTLMISTVEVSVAHLFARRTTSTAALFLARMTTAVAGFCTLEVTCERLAAWNLRIM